MIDRKDNVLNVFKAVETKRANQMHWLMRSMQNISTLCLQSYPSTILLEVLHSLDYLPQFKIRIFHIRLLQE
nr:hypothetical protein [Tanacetum cinerariifolium]